MLREGDVLARKILDDELALLTNSLTTGAPIKFDYLAALSGTGNGWYSGSMGNELNSTGVSTASRTSESEGWDEAEVRERDFGTM